MYAVNLADLTKPRGADQFCLSILLQPVLGETIEADKARVDETVVVLNCDDGRAEAIVDTIRLKYRSHELRCYSGHGHTWKRLGEVTP